MLKPKKNPEKSKKSMSVFSHVTGVFHWKIFATVFLSFIADGGQYMYLQINGLSFPVCAINALKEN